MPVATVIIVQGDAISRIVGKLKNRKDLSAIDLTGATLPRIRWIPNSGVAVERNATILTPLTTGQMAYQVEAGDFATNGEARAQFEFTNSAGRRGTSEEFVIQVDRKI